MALSTRSDVIIVPPNDVPSWVLVVTISQYFQVGIITALIYDTVLTMDKEIKYCWKPKLAASTVVYFLNRYIGILGVSAALVINVYGVNLQQCNFAVWTSKLSYWITIMSFDYILLLRVMALYSHEKKMKLFLTVLLILAAGFKLALLIYNTLFNDVVIAVLAESVTSCADNYPAPLKWEITDWTIPMAYDLLLMILALYKATGYWRLSAGLKGINLVKVLILDQAVYFLAVVFCCVFGILMATNMAGSNHFTISFFAALGSPTFLCILGSRIFFHLKEAGELGLNEGTRYRYELSAASAIKFA